jgi:hypothetical protein
MTITSTPLQNALQSIKQKQSKQTNQSNQHNNLPWMVLMMMT